MCNIDFNENADNVYRTKYYIVKQILTLNNTSNDNNMISEDIFYLRTKKRDIEYNILFKERTNLEGKRIPCTMCSRKYYC